jgi:hypothetical protein
LLIIGSLWEKNLSGRPDTKILGFLDVFAGACSSVVQVLLVRVIVLQTPDSPNYGILRLTD